MKIAPLLWPEIPTAFIFNGSQVAKLPGYENFPKEDMITVWSLKMLQKRYNPFDFYYKPVPEKVAVDILGNTNGYEHKLHTLFASVDCSDDEKVLRLVQNFGLPDYFLNPEIDDKFNLHKQLDLEVFFLDSINNIKKSLLAYQVIFQFIHIVRSEAEIDVTEVSRIFTKDVYDILHYDKEKTYKGKRATHKEMLAWLKKATNIRKSLWIIVSEHLNSILAKIPIRLGSNETFDSDIYWECAYFKDIKDNCSLLESLYLMLILDMTIEKKPPKLCAEATCNNFFTPSRPKAIYCSITCQNRATLKRYRSKRQKKDKDN